jgi:hypothetical protein
VTSSAIPWAPIEVSPFTAPGLVQVRIVAIHGLIATAAVTAAAVAAAGVVFRSFNEPKLFAILCAALSAHFRGLIIS